jgi:hypothetical protein
MSVDRDLKAIVIFLAVTVLLSVFVAGYGLGGGFIQ